jgi:transcriptional regulator with XRE-family HTH domain
MTTTYRSAGDYLREWRQRRRLSQLDLALEAEISTRHLSFMETGRSVPSREMVLRLSERLDMPLRERNALLVAAGYAPVYSERRLDEPAAEPARKAMELVLAGHEPYPALAIDRHWNLIMFNKAVPPLLAGVAPELMTPPVNVLRLSLHPGGLAPRIVNYWEWRNHLLARLRQQIALTGDEVLESLMSELAGYPPPENQGRGHFHGTGNNASAGNKGSNGNTAGAVSNDYADVVVPLQFSSEAGVLSFISTTTVFGTPVDVTVSELALESFFPANAGTAEILRQLAANQE